MNKEAALNWPKATGRTFKRTPQRLAILAYLQGNTSHPSAERIHRDLVKTYPSLSLATVYNTLRALQNMGELQELGIDPGRSRFDPDVRPHSHLFCRECGLVADVPRDLDVRVDEADRQGFQIEGVRVEFTGICPRCRDRQGLLK